ncbi:probable WRKY transcription factor 53 [Rosa rugosa]|uniref:probable WRKY transcription factor 53 n=1 Tax=Rosa rugosa TaxID=74645 RepID=UPI002B4046E0|nr:probable WRKY transcription factor 53 [Rosa rugosa]
MDTASKSWEQKSLVGEIIQGMELAQQLRLSLSATSTSSETREFLVQRILTSYEKALLLLQLSGTPQTPHVDAKSIVPQESRMSANTSPCGDDYNHRSFNDHQDLHEISKKRKIMAKWTDHVIRVSSENGIEGPHEDGHSWRKYGQKDILGAKYPRSYYRCTFRNTQNCWATKQVQRSDEDPTIFEITYKGKHTCSHGSTSVPPPPSPEQKEQKRHKRENISEPQQSQVNQMSFPTNLRVDTENLEDREMMASPFAFTSTSFGCMMSGDDFLSPMFDNENFFSDFSQHLLSPAAGESNYHLAPPSQMRNIAVNGQLSESDHTEIISATNSSTNSPIPDMDFPLDLVEFDPNFQFDAPEFF